MGNLVQICAYFDAHRFLKLMADEGTRAFLVWQDRVKPKSKDCLTTAKSLDMIIFKHLVESPIQQCNVMLDFFSVLTAFFFYVYSRRKIMLDIYCWCKFMN
jgi:hypothetical protein